MKLPRITNPIQYILEQINILKGSIFTRFRNAYLPLLSSSVISAIGNNIHN